METERQVTLPVAHPYLMSVPEAGSQLPLLVALHGYGGDMTSMMRLAQTIAGSEMIVASLQGVHQFWTPAVEAVETRRTGFGWLTNHRPEPSQARHHALVEAVIAEARREFGADRARVLLMGFSQSCALNYRLAFTRPGLLRGVIGVCGGIPGDFDDPKYREIPASILHIAASQDPFYSTDRTRGFAGALRRLARDVTYREYESGHVFPRDSLSFIREWILARCSGQGTGIG